MKVGMAMIGLVRRIESPHAIFTGYLVGQAF